MGGALPRVEQSIRRMGARFTITPCDRRELPYEPSMLPRHHCGPRYSSGVVLYGGRHDAQAEGSLLPAPRAPPSGSTFATAHLERRLTATECAAGGWRGFDDGDGGRG